MPNQPSPETVTVSFTLPRPLAEAVNQHARLNMTNKSDIIRRALLEYLSPEERASIVREVTEEYRAETKKKSQE